jgi:hypothetical protein
MQHSNDDLELENSKPFITEHNSSALVRQRGYAGKGEEEDEQSLDNGERKRLAEEFNSDSARIVEKKVTVFKIEDAEPPSPSPGSSAQLPDNANFDNVVENILGTLRIKDPKFSNKKLSATWREHFKATECKSILSDMFWYTLVKLDSRPDMKAFKKSALERISYNYIQLFVKVPRFEKELFFDTFYDCIAQGVFYSMFFAYPKSRSRLSSEEFKSKLFSMVSKKLTGIQVGNQAYNHWNLDLGAGNVLKTHGGKAKDSAGPLLPTLHKRQIRRTLQQLRYSPLVTRYLHEKRYEAINSVPSWNMRYTNRSVEKEKDTDKKYVFYKKLAIDTEKKAKERHREYQEESSKIDDEIKEEHREYRRYVNRLNKKTDEIIAENSAEYANKLVSLSFLQREEKRQGYIPLF